jgi:hypothetical protein
MRLPSILNSCPVDASVVIAVRVAARWWANILQRWSRFHPDKVTVSTTRYGPASPRALPVESWSVRGSHQSGVVMSGNGNEERNERSA